MGPPYTNGTFSTIYEAVGIAGLLEKLNLPIAETAERREEDQ